MSHQEPKSATDAGSEGRATHFRRGTLVAGFGRVAFFSAALSLACGSEEPDVDGATDFQCTTDHDCIAEHGDGFNCVEETCVERGSTDAGEAWQPLISGDWTLDPASEDYFCVRQTMTEDVWVRAFRPIAPPGTHHTLVGLADPAEGAPDGASKCTMFDQGTEFLMGSGVGTEPFELPEGVAVKLAAGRQIILNLHIFNSDTEPLDGTSGIEVQFAEQSEVVHEAETILAGTTGIAAEPGESTMTGYCTLADDVTVFSVVPHMHELGVHMTGRAMPWGSDATTTLVDSEYDFDNQQFMTLESPVTLARGDRIKVDCTYQNPSTTVVNFGGSSKNEMCWLGLYLYPPLSGLPFCADPAGTRLVAGGLECGTDGTADGLEVLTSGLSPLGVVAVDGTSIYFANGGPPSGLLKVPLGGGAPTMLTSDNPADFAVDATDVYWVDSYTGTVAKVPLEGGTPTTLASEQYGDSIAIDATSVYWSSSLFGTVKKMPLQGGAVTELASGVDSPSFLAVSGGWIYWTTGWAGTVSRMPIEGGTPTIVASDQPGPREIRVDAENVFWINQMGATVMRMPIDGGTPVTLAEGKGPPTEDTGAIAIDADNVYWVDTSDASIMKVSKAGGAPTTLVTGQPRVGNLAVDATSVYVTTACGTVVKFQK